MKLIIDKKKYQPYIPVNKAVCVDLSSVRESCKSKGQSRMNNPETLANKRQRKSKGQ
jgi:hypothetical protein